MGDVRHNRLERFETWAAECELIARLITHHSKQKQYDELAAHYYYLATSFRKAVALHSAILAKLTLH
jgi:hypothetical protein